MKSPFLILISLLMIGVASAQVSINNDAAHPDESAMLDVKSNKSGVLIPRMTSLEKSQIANPADALLIYQTDGVAGFYYNKGTSVAANWQLLGGEDMLLSSRIPISELPFVISQPGSYYVTGHLTGTTGISISAPNVTIDLNGYSIIAEVGSSGDGISSTTVISNISISNGNVIGWADKGIDLANTDYAVLTHLTIGNNGGDGIAIGDHGIINICTVRGSGFDGIDVGDNVSIQNCIVSTSTDNGVEADNGATLINVKSSDNTGSGIRVGTESVLENTVTNSNGEVGVFCNTGSSLNRCSSSNNTGAGYELYSACRSTNSLAKDNGADGYTVLSDCRLEQNTADGNSLSGFKTTSSDVSFISNHSTDNGTHGYNVISSFGCVLMSNVAMSNTGANYNLSANNAAPIITSAAITTASNPFANIDF